MSRVSVIVPTFKRTEELKNALESLAGQRFSDIEIILVDDNASAEWNAKVAGIVGDFRNRYPQLELKYVINKSNQGSAKTRNIGIDLAKGEYITFLDDDDIYLPDKIGEQVEFMEKGGYDYCITDLFLYSEDGKLIDKRVRSYINDTRHEALQVYHLKYHMTGTDTMMFSREYLAGIGGFAPIDVGDEFYLMQRAIEGGGKFGYLPGCELKAYVHTGEGGLSSGDGKIKGENALYEYKKGYFDKLEPKDVRYIKMRHYAVLAYAELRRKRYIAGIYNAVRALLAEPSACIKTLLEAKK